MKKFIWIFLLVSPLGAHANGPECDAPVAFATYAMESCRRGNEVDFCGKQGLAALGGLLIAKGVGPSGPISGATKGYPSTQEFNEIAKTASQEYMNDPKIPKAERTASTAAFSENYWSRVKDKLIKAGFVVPLYVEDAIIDGNDAKRMGPTGKLPAPSRAEVLDSNYKYYVGDARSKIPGFDSLPADVQRSLYEIDTARRYQKRVLILESVVDRSYGRVRETQLSRLGFSNEAQAKVEIQRVKEYLKEMQVAKSEFRVLEFARQNLKTLNTGTATRQAQDLALEDYEYKKGRGGSTKDMKYPAKVTDSMMDYALFRAQVLLIEENPSDFDYTDAEKQAMRKDLDKARENASDSIWLKRTRSLKSRIAAGALVAGGTALNFADAIAMTGSSVWGAQACAGESMSVADSAVAGKYLETRGSFCTRAVNPLAIEDIAIKGDNDVHSIKELCENPATKNALLDQAGNLTVEALRDLKTREGIRVNCRSAMPSSEFSANGRNYYQRVNLSADRPYMELALSDPASWKPQDTVRVYVEGWKSSGGKLDKAVLSGVSSQNAGIVTMMTKGQALTADSYRRMSDTNFCEFDNAPKVAANMPSASAANACILGTHLALAGGVVAKTMIDCGQGKSSEAGAAQ